MSKLSFRARALDACKPMPVFWSEEIPDLPDFAAINRAVPQMPTGMEKEEESEHHLQRAISAQQAYGQTGDLVIPTPEVDCGVKEYEKFYPTDFKIPKQLVHVQALNMEQDIPDYDMDTEDEEWVNQQTKKMEITPLQFEEMMDRLEKGSGQQVVTLKEAKLLLKEDDDLIIAVYDYWLNKRLKMQLPLIPQVKTEKRDGSTNNNPYVAFRRRTEKMQTRKNRKNDETSYEKMLKLRRDLSRAVTLLEMVKRREKSKRELLHLTVEIFEKRYQLGDFTGQILSEVSAIKHTQPSYVSVNSQYTVNRHSNWTNRVDRVSREEVGVVRKKREYKKRKHKQPTAGTLTTSLPQYSEGDLNFTELFSSDEESISPGPQSNSDHEDDNDPDGIFAFRRKKGCNYHAHLDRLGNWPWCSREEGGLAEKRYRYTLTTISNPRRTIGFARRRVGRGGRILLDRAWTPLDEYLCELDVSSSPSLPNGLPGSEILAEIKANHWLHFRPLTPPTENTESPTSPRLLPGAVAAVPEFNVASFQSHQEQLIEMQRQQMERLRQQEEENSSQDSSQYSEHSSSSHTNLTLDSATAQFAASAVITGNQVSSLINGASVASSVLTNGLATATTPSIAGELVTLAPQMQLGFPLSGSSMSQPSPAPLCVLPKSTKIFKPPHLANDKVSGQGDASKTKLDSLMSDKVRVMEVT